MPLGLAWIQGHCDWLVSSAPLPLRIAGQRFSLTFSWPGMQSRYGMSILRAAGSNERG